MKRGRENVIGLGAGDAAVIRRVGPRHDGLRAQHLEWPLVAGLGAEHTDDVVLERQLVDDGKALTAADDVERRRVLPTVQTNRTLAAQPESRRAPAIDLDATRDGDGANDIGA